MHKQRSWFSVYLSYFYVIFSCLTTVLFCLQVSAWAQDPALALKTERRLERVLRLTVNATINPATYNYIANGIKQAKLESFDAILLELNTPGGLVSTTKNILIAIGESEIPVIVWVRPEGASATSAGAIIASAAHVLLMSEGTNIGAATPVEMGGDIQKDLRQKAVNDLVALVKSLAQSRGRNGELFAKMITEAASYEARSAAQQKLIDGIANNRDEMLSVVDGKTALLGGKAFVLRLAERVDVVDLPMDLGQRLLNIFAGPNMAYILFLIGAALLYLEFQAPGGFIAGSVGVLCLLLAGIGFQVLPLNFGALGLIIVAFVLFILEIYITSYGLLSLAGLAALVVGSLFLYRTDNAYLEISTSFVVACIGAIGAFLGFVVLYIARDRHKVREEFNGLVGKRGIILSELLELNSDGEYWYQIKVAGEVWKLKSTRELVLGESYEVRAQDKEDMILY